MSMRSDGSRLERAFCTGPEAIYPPIRVLLIQYRSNILDISLQQAIQQAGALLLQREIPEVVNTIFAKVPPALTIESSMLLSFAGCLTTKSLSSTASANLFCILQIAMSARVPVVLDAGGGMDPIGADLLANISILSPNETELSRLTGARGARG